MIHRYEHPEEKQLHDDILKAYYVQHGKGSSDVKLEGGSIRFTKRNKKHRLQHGNGFFDAFATPLIKFLVPSLVKGVGSATISKIQGNSLKDSLKKGASSTVEDAVLRKGKSLLTNALTAQ
jgi:hypothetical protein